MTTIKIRIEAHAISDPYARHHGKAIDQILNRDFWDSQPEKVRGTTYVSFIDEQTVDLPEGTHYVIYGNSSAVGYEWHSKIYINGELKAEGDVERGKHLRVEFVIGEAPPSGELKSKIDRAWAEPSEIEGRVCENFTLRAEGHIYDTVGSATVWIDVVEVSGSRAYSPEPWSPSTSWNYHCNLHVAKDLTGDVVLTVRSGCVIAGVDVETDRKAVTIKVIISDEKASLSGTVAGLFDRPVGGALVEIDNGTYKKTTTNSLGEFEFTDIELSTWDLAVSHILYNTQKKTVSVTEEKTYTEDVKLGIKTLIIAPVVAVGVIGLFIGGVRMTGGKKEIVRGKEE